MKAMMLALLLSAAPWMSEELQEASTRLAASGDRCSAVYESANKRAPADTKVIHYTNQALFLIYHHLSEEESTVTITPAKFEQHLRALQEHHYNVISIEEYSCFAEQQKPLPPNAVVLTFDDGYRSFYETAYPLLKKRGLTATNFVIVHELDSQGPGISFLTWEQLAEMKRDGFSFYSHTYNLHRKNADETGQPEAMLTHRIQVEGEQRLETEEEWKHRVLIDLAMGEIQLKSKLGNEFSMLCFPFGEYNQTVMDEAERIGFRHFLTTREGINSGSGREIYRVHAGMPYMTAEKLIRKLQSYDRR